ncbi:hypothetical protein RND61_23650 [Streptomyces sp. TRM76323]|uniref:Uncharacterized protein n=1 Tax=Streptomyces tamarix TaxID=3078565 RepID=A0ABU3QQJ4_9ACTN|nr:hypothetical protein [Streptomyces tamarix]MDT9685030.1 hypothetical protein [Streptomyces tamarix]
MYSEEHTGLDGWPYDQHAYDLRAAQRTAGVAAAFDTVRDAAHHLLATAEAQLVALPARTVQSRWTWQLGTLHDALTRLDSLHEEWLETRDNLPLNARAGTDAYDDALAAHHARAWSCLYDWATHGQAILDIHAAARRAPSTSAPCTAALKAAPRVTAGPRPVAGTHTTTTAAPGRGR